jgi:hypothetical protein
MAFLSYLIFLSIFCDRSRVWVSSIVDLDLQGWIRFQVGGGHHKNDICVEKKEKKVVTSPNFIEFF